MDIRSTNRWAAAAALALLFGMLTDSGYFRFAKKETLLTFSEIMGIHDIQMDEAMNLVDLDTDISERISQLKGAQRLKYWKVGEHIVATSQGSAYEASVCKSLLGLGADIVFVGSQRGEQFRVSARATQAMVRKGVHLGKLMGGVGSETSNGGGGHPGAAGLCPDPHGMAGTRAAAGRAGQRHPGSGLGAGATEGLGSARAEAAIGRRARPVSEELSIFLPR